MFNLKSITSGQAHKTWKKSLLFQCFHQGIKPTDGIKKH